MDVRRGKDLLTGGRRRKEGKREGERKKGRKESHQVYFPWIFYQSYNPVFECKYIHL